jgi:hypothetical protein
MIALIFTATRTIPDIRKKGAYFFLVIPEIGITLVLRSLAEHLIQLPDIASLLFASLM